METNENIQALDYLLSLKKKKKDFNLTERKRFTSEWTKLINSEGFSPRVEKYLYNGFVFCGAWPFKEYMQKSGEPSAVLQNLYNGKLYKVNCASTVSILCHLLTLYFNDSNQNLTVIVSLMKELPSAMKNKEGGMYGQANRCMKKYFFDKLHVDAKLPEFQSLYSNGLKKKEALEFAKVINCVMNEKNVDYSKWKVESRKNVSLVTKWLQSISTANMAELVEHKCTPKQDAQPKPTAKSLKKSTDSPKISDASQNAKKVVSQDTENAKNSATATKNDQLDSEKINQLNKELQDIKKALADATAARDQAFIAQQEDQKKQQQLQNELSQRAEILHLTEKRVSEQLQLLSAEKKKNEELEAALVQQKELAEKSMEMVEILRRDKEKQLDETVKRLASRLRTYYLDYKDAISLEMSIDLGENMRDQLGEVFKILQDAGIIMK